MILVDANLLIYAKVADFPQHGMARAWLEERLASPSRVGLPWPSLLAFLRITTHPRIFDRPLDAPSAWRQVREWIDQPSVWIPSPTDRHADVLQGLMKATHVTGGLVPDAHLAALALEHGLKLCSSDHDFARFPGLSFEDPLATAARA